MAWSDPTLSQTCRDCVRAAEKGLQRCPTCGTPVDATVEDLAASTGFWHVVGSSLDADIRLDVAGGKQARIRRVEGNKIEVEDLGSGILVDGKKVKHAVVSAKARIEIGGTVVPAGDLPDDILEPEDLPQHSAPVLIGRDPACDYVVQERTVSAKHARLTREKDGLLLEDLGSSNGTYVDGEVVERAHVGWRQVFSVSDINLTPLQVFKKVRAERRAAATAFVQAPQLELEASKEEAEAVSLVQDRTVIGRGSDADVVVDSPQVSLRHALLECKGGGLQITDLGSTNGTYVHGQRITKPTRVEPGDVVHLGGYPLQLGTEGGIQSRPRQKVRGTHLNVRDLVLQVGERVVVDRVGLNVQPGEMVAIMGPSGAGKTSLLTVLAGDTPPTAGQVLFDGLGLHEHLDLFRHGMGYVPQEDVMHRALTASEVLFFTGRLSYPDDASGEEIRARVAKVLKQLDLSHVADSVVGDEVTRGLSGGERKRLNVGMELMKEPALLLLDEPTSGLDGRSAMQLVKQCRGLANSGRTVMMTIHQPRQEVLQLFDKVLFLTHGGKLAYFGPPARIRHYFQQRVTGSPITATNPSDYALEALEPTDRSSAKPPEYWEKAYRNSDLFGQYVEKGSPSGELTAVKAAAAAAVGQHGAVRQFVTLAWRYGLVKLRDRGALLLLLLQAPIIAAVTALLFSRARFVPLRGEDDVTPALFVLMAAAVWFGTSNVAREVIGEKAIFTRESRRAVTAGPYFLGMVVVQSAIMLAQLLVLVGTVFFVVKLQCNVGLLLLVAFAAGVAGMMMGLLLSALVRSQLAALVFVPLLILPQLLLSGQFAPVGGTDVALVTKVAASPMLVRWAFSAATQVEYPPVTDEMDNADPATYRAEKGREWVLPRLGFDKDIQGIPLLLCVSIGFLAAIATYLLLLRRGRGGGSEPPARRDAIKAK